ncbi:MAG: hypothetical protein JO321_08185 [Solirubrobacterales bacterium]|nr:hypothetical protein [Solirubrobacterales bacterium]MBV9167921.1 hypothetical protein [Solirubrobacterales bacterium]MBV9535371.1 hypothetical protein [Solirubrobacterales bacterium]
MWLLFILGFLVLLALVGGALAGGIFTIVLIPLAAIALISAIVYTYFGGAAQRRAGGERGVQRPPTPPTTQQPSSAPAPSTPEELADARRANQ